MLDGGRSATPGGKEVGNLLWICWMMNNLAVEELGEVDLRVMSDEHWARILQGDGVMKALKAEILMVYLEEEGYEVDKEREAEIAVVAGERVEYCWNKYHGLQLWQEACIESERSSRRRQIER